MDYIKNLLNIILRWHLIIIMNIEIKENFFKYYILDDKKWKTMKWKTLQVY